MAPKQVYISPVKVTEENKMIQVESTKKKKSMLWTNSVCVL